MSSSVETARVDLQNAIDILDERSKGPATEQEVIRYTARVLGACAVLIMNGWEAHERAAEAYQKAAEAMLATTKTIDARQRRIQNWSIGLGVSFALISAIATAIQAYAAIMNVR